MILHSSILGGGAASALASELVPGGAGGGGGQDGLPGKSAYQLAVQQGFSGTLDEWLASLRGADGTDGENGADALFLASELLPLLPGRDGEPGAGGGGDVLLFASELLPALPGEKGEPGGDGEDALIFASEIIGLLAGADGKDGRDGRDALFLASELLPAGGAPEGGDGLSLRLAELVITAENASNMYFDLPEGFPDACASMKRHAALAAGADIQAEGKDSEITADAAGRLRRVSWAGLGLQSAPPMQEGWSVSLWYSGLNITC